MADEQSNNVLIPEANIHLVKDLEYEVNDEEKNVELEKEVTKKGKCKGKEKAKKKKDFEFKWRKRPTPNQKQPSDLGAEITYPFPEHHTTFNVFSVVTNIDTLVKMIIEQSNLFAQENGREFQTNEEEMMTVNNKLPTIASYWEWMQCIGKRGIRNAMTRTSFKDILQNLYFSNNTKVSKLDH